MRFVCTHHVWHHHIKRQRKGQMCYQELYLCYTTGLSPIYVHTVPSILVCHLWLTLSLSLSLCLSSYLQTTGIRWDNTHTHTLYKSRVLYKSHLKRANIRSNLVWPYWCFEMKRREVRLPKENTDELYRKACHLICSTRPHTQWLNRWIGQWPSKQHI